MKTFLAFLLASTSAFAVLPHEARAQTTVVTTTEPEDAFGPDDDVVVREYVVRRAPATIVLREPMTLRPGSVVPADVALAPMADVGAGKLRRFAFFVSPDDKVVVVDPATRVVVRILNR